MEAPDRKKNEKQGSGLKNYAKYTGIAFQMAFIILAGVFGGKKLDEYVGNESPIFMAICTLLAFGAAMYYLFKGLTGK